MFANDSEDSNGFDFSPFDRAKIEDLEIGETVIAENASFGVNRRKNDYVLVLQRGKETGVFPFTSLEKLFEKLEDN